MIWSYVCNFNNLVWLGFEWVRRLISNWFPWKPLETKRFASIKGLLRVFGTMWLTRDLHQKFFRTFSRKLFSSTLFHFWKVVGWEYGFLLFSVGEEWFSRLMRIPSGIFWGCKIDEILTLLSFYPWLSVWYCSLVFFWKVHNFLKCLRSTASPPC